MLDKLRALFSSEEAAEAPAIETDLAAASQLRLPHVCITFASRLHHVCITFASRLHLRLTGGLRGSLLLDEG